MIKLSHRITLAAISLFGILNILLIPFRGGGLFPDDFEPQFFNMIEEFGDAVEELSALWFAIPYLLPVLVLVGCVFMLIASLIGHKGLCIASGAVGIGLWIVPFIVFIADASTLDVDFENIFEALFDFDYGLVAIGSWIALIIFIAFLIMSCIPQEKVKVFTAPGTPNDPYAGYQYQNNFQNNNFQNNGYQATTPNDYANNMPVNDTPVTPYNDANNTPYTNTEATPFVPNNEVAPEEPSATDIYANSGVAEAVEPAKPAQTDETTEDAKFCPSCGTKADADAMFCGTCGHKF